MRKLAEIDYRREYNEFVGSLDDKHIQPLDTYGDEYVDSLGEPERHLGNVLPWPKTECAFRLRDSEVTLWAGYNGSGKSGVLGQIMTNLAFQGEKVLVASFEMPVKKLLERHCAQIEGRKLGKGDENRFWEIMALTETSYWIYSQTMSMDVERVAGMISHAAKTHGISHFVIDSLVKCGVRRTPDHAENLERFVDLLQVLAKRYKIHIHLVHHMRKPPDHSQIPTKFDVKYAGEIVDLVDNAVLVWRNKAKECNAPAPVDSDTLLIVDKQRHHPWEGRITLNFNKNAMRWEE